MIQIILMLVIIGVLVIKLINYGRWAGRQGNLRGMLGLYLLAVSTIVLPFSIYILNLIR
jgi:hypothetical protein